MAYPAESWRGDLCLVPVALVGSPGSAEASMYIELIRQIVEEAAKTYAAQELHLPPRRGSGMACATVPEGMPGGPDSRQV